MVDVRDTESMQRSFRTRVRCFDFSGGARVVMPLAGGGAAMGERGGGRREKPRKIRLWAAHLKSWHGFCFGLRGYHETRAFG